MSFLGYEGKTAIVTGAATGIGRGLVDGLLAEGARVVANDLRGLDDLADVPDVAVVEADVTAPETPAALVEAALELGGLDAVFNNAAVVRYGATLGYAREDWDRTIAVNLTACFTIAQAAGRVMTEQRSGAILNVASVAGEHGIPNSAAYTVAKHGVVGLTRALAVEWACYGVRVNALCPGFTQTPLADQFRDQSPEQYAQRAARVPLGRAGLVSEQVAAALFLASDRSGYTTGQIAHVDGGGHALYSGYAAPLRAGNQKSY